MTTNEIMLLNGTDNKEHKKIIQKVLRKVGPLSRYSDEERVPIEALEKMITTITKKYAIQPQWIVCIYSGELAGKHGYYSCGVKTADMHTWLGTVTTHCIYDLLAKLVIFMYAQVKAGKIALRVDMVSQNGGGAGK